MRVAKYEDFSLVLALVYAIPVLCFSAAMLVVAGRFRNIPFLAGAVLCTLAGACKVIWKILIAVKQIDIEILSKQMRIVMPLGFVLIIIGLVAGMNSEMWKQLGKSIISFPAVIPFGVTLLGVICMGVFAVKLDQQRQVLTG